MLNLRYVSKNDFLKIYEEDIRENSESAALVCIKYFGRNANFKDKRVLASKELHKQLRDRLATRITCPIYVIEIGDPENGEYIESSEFDFIKKFDINSKSIPTIILFNNGNIVKRFNSSDSNYNINDVINGIKKL